MPWHLPEDLKYFQQATLGSTVVMGRRTWESLDPRWRPLPGRRNVVVTRDRSYVASGAEVETSLDDALSLDVEAWVIGGGELYRQAIERATLLDVTVIDVEVSDGDTLAPPITDDWVSEGGAWQYAANGLRFRRLRYTRRAGSVPLPFRSEGCQLVGV
jgi:dihydrofolate reductase